MILHYFLITERTKILHKPFSHVFKPNDVELKENVSLSNNHKTKKLSRFRRFFSNKNSGKKTQILDYKKQFQATGYQSQNSKNNNNKENIKPGSILTAKEISEEPAKIKSTQNPPQKLSALNQALKISETTKIPGQSTQEHLKMHDQNGQLDWKYLWFFSDDSRSSTDNTNSNTTNTTNNNFGNEFESDAETQIQIKIVNGKRERRIVGKTKKSVGCVDQDFKYNLNINEYFEERDAVTIQEQE